MSIRNEIVERLCRCGVSETTSEEVLDVLVEAGYQKLARQPNSSREGFLRLGPTDELILMLYQTAEEISSQEIYRLRQNNITYEKLAVQHRQEV